MSITTLNSVLVKTEVETKITVPDAATKETVAQMLAAAKTTITAELLAKDKKRATEVLLALRLQFSSHTSSIIIK